MNRREFLYTLSSLTAAAALGAPASLLAKPSSALRLTIMHTNDVHSRLDPMDVGEDAGLGGAAARMTMIKQLRAEHENTLLLDAGDILQGTPYFNLFNGEPEVKAMNLQGYDAGTIGNHEFDPGIERLAELTRMMNFPLLCCNYDFLNTPMEGLTRESMVMERGGLRIGLLGLGIMLDELVMPGAYGETKYLPPIREAHRVARQLRHEERCDFIIALSHINLFSIHGSTKLKRQPGDRDLIANVSDIDVVLGGHNHIWLQNGERHRRRNGTIGTIAQTGWAGTHLGFLQFDIYDRDRNEAVAVETRAVG